MKNFTQKILILLFVLACVDGYAQRQRRAITPFIAGAELKARSINVAPKLSPQTKDTIEVKLIIYRDCEANPGNAYVKPNIEDTLIALVYSVSLCEYSKLAMWYNEAESDANTTPLCPYQPAITKCNTANSANPGYRTEVYMDTIVLSGTASDWRIGHQYAGGPGLNDNRMNWYPKKYDVKGERCSIQQISPPPINVPPYLAQVPASAAAGSPFPFRINGVNTASQQNDPTEGYFYIEMTYSNMIPDGKYQDGTIRYKGNTTPNSAANPLIFQCTGRQRTYDLGYYDAEGHTMKFYKSTPMKAACFGDPTCGQTDRTISYLTWANGCSESNPLCGNATFNLDQNTGVIDMTSDPAVGVGKFKSAFRITEEDASGNIIGEVYRDVVITLINDNNTCNDDDLVANSSYFYPSDSTKTIQNCALAANRDKVIEACAGTTIKFSVKAFTTSPIPNAALVITAELDPKILQTGGFVSSSYNPSVFPKTAEGLLTWSIPSTLPAGIYPVVFQIRDCINPGYILSRTVVYKIRVNKKNKLEWSYIGYEPRGTKGIFELNPASGRTYNCGSGMSHLLTSSGTEVDASYIWNIYQGNNTSSTPIYTEGPPNSNPFLNPNANFTTGNNYVVEMITNQYCNNRDTLLVIDKPSISPVLNFVTTDTCFATVPTLQVSGLSFGTALTSFYDWQAINSEYYTTPSYLSNTAQGYLVRQNNIYNVYVITADTCIYPLNQTITLEGIKPRTFLLTDKIDYICPGDTITVSGVSTTSVCGSTRFSNPVGPIKTAALTGTESNTNASPKVFTASPSIDRGRTSILYKADELLKACLRPGIISSISFYIDGISDPVDYNNIDIWVKCTNRIDLANGQFEDTNQMIKICSYSTKNLTVGWNRFPINLVLPGISWDGEKNLIFDVFTSCNKACSGTVSLSPAYLDNLTNYVSIIGKYGNGRTAYDNASVVTSNFRHNIQFEYQELDESILKFRWDNDPSTLVSTLTPGSTGENELTPKIVSYIPRKYIVSSIHDFDTTSASPAKCVSYDTVYARVDTNFKITIDKEIAYKCPGDTVALNSTKGYLSKRPMILGCGANFTSSCNDLLALIFNNNANRPEDSIRKVDRPDTFLIAGNPTSTQGSTIHSPFGGVNATLGNATTDKRVQMLFTSSELKANARMDTGYISKIWFRMAAGGGKFANTNKLLNFSVRMKCAKNTQDSLLSNNFEIVDTSFDEVFFASEFETGFDTTWINLQNVFAWDGEKGIIIDICFNNFAGVSYNADRVMATSTGKKRRFMQSAANTTGAQPEVFGCAFTTGTRDTIRPNVGFVFTKPTRTPPPVPKGVNWAPTTYISNTQITNPTIYNEFTTNYYTILDYQDTTYNKSKTTCRVRDTFKSVVDRPYVKFEPPVAVACQGKSVLVSAGVVGMNQNLYTYEWDTTQFGKVKANYMSPNQIITPPNPGYHYVKVASINNPNCYNRDSIFVDIQNLKTMPDIGGTSLICPGDSVLLSIPTNVGYKNPKWVFNGSVIDTGYRLMVATPGNYSMIIDSGACTNISNVKVISFRTKETVRLIDTNLIVCEGDSALIMYNQANNVANPIWNNGQTTPYIKVTQSGQYYLIKPRDQYGCLMNVPDTAIVSLIANPDFKLLDDTLCLSDNQKIILQPIPYDPSATYRWEPDGRQRSYIEVYVPGTYKVTRKKGTCEKVAYATIVNDTAGPIDLGKNKAVCCDEVITLDANSLGKRYRGYKWSTGELSQVIYTKPNASGVYIVEAIKPNGCKDTGSIFIDSKCGKVSAKPENETIFLGQTNNIIGQHLAVKADKIIYNWIPSEQVNEIIKGNTLSPTAKARDTGDVEYVLIMTVIDSTYMPPKPFCIENEVVRFKVSPNKLDTIDAFSPDGDGINDYFYPRIKGIVKLKEFKIYNRFGQLLHNDADRPWDGKYNNELQPVGVYISLISYELNEPRRDKQVKYDKIPVTLVR